MRVLHVLPTRAAEYGGPVRVAEALAQHVAGHGIECELYPPAGLAPSRRLAYYPGVCGWLALASAVRSVDLVHLHGLWAVPTTAAAAWAHATRKPYIVTTHGMLDRWSVRQSAGKKRLYAALAERRTLTRASCIHFFNAGEAAQARDYVALSRYFLLPNGVDVAAFADLPGRAALDELVPAARGRTVALFLGRIHRKKGFDVLLPAMARIAARDLLLVVAGPDEGGHRREVEALAAALDLGAQVQFVGPVDGDAKRRLLGGSDFFVLPSHQESDSVAIKEALAAGLPLLISDRCHQPEIANAGAGVVVPPTVDGVRAGLGVLLRPDERAARGAAARRFAQRFDIAALATRLAAIYHAVAAGRRLPSSDATA